MKTRRSIFMGVAVMLVTSACSASTTTATDTSPTTSAPPPATTSAASTTTSEPVPPVTTPNPTTTTLPGEPYDLFVPQDGEELSVVGVAFDDVLNIRSGPGVSYDIVGTLAPTADQVAGTGQGRLLDSSVWWRVIAFGTEGWVNARFVSRTGDVVDLTAQVIETGGFFNAPGMEQLGAMVAEVVASVDPASDIVMSIAPTIGDLGEVTYDVIGLGDDSVRGYRLHVFGAVSGLGFSLKSVEATILCQRGTTAEGLCA